MYDAVKLSSLEGIAFVTDRDGTITAVGERNWNAFSCKNGAPELDAISVIGRSIFEYISGVEVRNELEQAMQRISDNPDWHWVLNYRCDSPGEKRNMRQSMRPIFSAGSCVGFLFQSVGLRSEQRPAIALFDFKEIERQAEQNKNLPVVMMCSWCQKFQYEPISGDQWVEGEAYYAAGGSSKVRLSHAICEDCLETASKTSCSNGMKNRAN